MTSYMLINGELYHHGIKGMKWGRRRYQNNDGSLTPAGIKRYARAGYAQDSYNRNKTVVGKAYDKFTGAHKMDGNMKYDNTSSKANKARAEKYVADKKASEARKDAFREERAQVNKARSTGYKLATNVLAGPFANRTYNSVIASGGSKYEAAAMTAVGAYMGGPIGHLAISALYTHNAGKK